MQATNIANQNVALNQNEGFNALDAAANTNTGVATTPGVGTGVSIGNPSTAATVGPGPAISGANIAGVAPSLAAPVSQEAAAPVSAGVIGVPSAPVAVASAPAAPADGFGSNLGFDAGGSLYSSLIGQYPWMQFQPTS